MKNVKLIVTDMDGTLLNSKEEVDRDFFELFKTIKQHNIKFVAASGRQHGSICNKLKTIVNDITVVSENGALIKEKDKTLLFTNFPLQQIKLLIPVIKKIKDVHIILAGKSAAYIDSIDADFNNLFSEYYKDFCKVDDLAAIDIDDFMKIAIYHPIDSETYIYPELKHLEPNYKIKVSGKHWVDISLPNANKGYALSFLQKRWNIKPEETMVFGDYNNDLEMLALGHFSYAMANAHENVKAIANYSTKSNDENGVSFILKQLLKSKTE